MRHVGLLVVVLAGCLGPAEPSTPQDSAAVDDATPPAAIEPVDEPAVTAVDPAAVDAREPMRFAPAWFDCEMLTTAVPASASAVAEHLPPGYSPAETPDGVTALVVIVGRCAAVLVSNATYLPEQAFAWAIVTVEPPAEVRHEGGQDAYVLAFRSDTGEVAAQAMALNLSALEADIEVQPTAGWVTEWTVEATAAASSFRVRAPSASEARGDVSESFYLHWDSPAGPMLRQVQAVYAESDAVASVTEGDLPGLAPAGSAGLSFLRYGSFAVHDVGPGET